MIVRTTMARAWPACREEPGMCSSKVAATVQKAIRANGGGVDRRRLLAGGMAAVASGAMGPIDGAAQGATPVATPGPSAIYSSSVSISRIHDLTHVSGPNFPVFVGAEQMQMEEITSIEDDGYFKYRLALDEHTGTHIDAPAHFIPGGTTADALSPSVFFAPLCVIDLSERAAADPDAVVTDGDIASWEAINGTIPDRAFVAMYSGWDARVDDAERYVNMGDDGLPHFPGWSGEAVAFLNGERTVVGIGTDTLSLDPGISGDFLAHVNALQAGMYGVENLANLGTVPPVGTMVIVGGPRHIGASGGPARVFAVELLMESSGAGASVSSDWPISDV
jgi:kynurenine formamidase